MTVVHLNGDGTDLTKPNAHAIALLEATLERAKSGEICGVGIVALHRDNSSSWWTGGQIGTFGLLGTCDMIKYSIMEVLQS